MITKEDVAKIVAEIEDKWAESITKIPETKRLSTYGFVVFEDLNEIPDILLEATYTEMYARTYKALDRQVNEITKEEVLTSLVSSDFYDYMMEDTDVTIFYSSEDLLVMSNVLAMELAEHIENKDLNFYMYVCHKRDGQENNVDDSHLVMFDWKTVLQSVMSGRDILEGVMYKKPFEWHYIW